jgi:hypothetical protein
VLLDLSRAHSCLLKYFDIEREEDMLGLDEVEDKIIVLDVGGQLFKTRRSTLMRGSGGIIAKQTFFSAALEDEASFTEPLFIDRSPVYFVIVLDYLRSGEMHCPSSLSLRRAYEELDYFCLGAPESNHFPYPRAASGSVLTVTGAEVFESQNYPVRMFGSAVSTGSLRVGLEGATKVFFPSNNGIPLPNGCGTYRSAENTLILPGTQTYKPDIYIKRVLVDQLGKAGWVVRLYTENTETYTLQKR